jgi:hypothetical protein
VPAEEEIVGFRAVDATDLVDVAEPLGGDERAGRAGPLQDGVDRNRGAVQEQPRRAELRPCLRDAALDPGDEPCRRGQRLPETQLPGVLIERGDIGEGPAHVG